MGGGGIGKERLKNLEAALEELKETGGGNGIDEERIKKLEVAMKQLKEMSSVEGGRRQNLDEAIEKLTETETQSEKPLTHNPAVSESELNELGIGAGIGNENEDENEIVDTVTLAQLMQWVDSALNLIGVAKLNQIVELYGLTGRIPEEMKDTILKVTELPDAVLSPEKNHIETKHCIIALCELDRILTGEHQELFVLLKELCNDHRPFKNPTVKHSQIQIQTKSQSPSPRKTEKEKKKVKPKPKKNG